jgi:hypothetical protein
MAIREDEFSRQSDRSVDNLRSLYAVLFGLSFSLTLTGAYDKVHGALVGQGFDGASVALHAFVTLSFLCTLSLFHYQTDRYLDVVYRRTGLLEVRPPLFLLDLVRGLLSMAPIYLMAQSLGEEPFRQVGFTWYVLAAAVFLLSNTLFLSWPGPSRRLAAGEAPDPVSERMDALRVFWLLLNSTCMVLLFILYHLFRSTGEVCPARGESGLQVGFVTVFALIILVRDTVDISLSWPVLHPATSAAEPPTTSRILVWLGRKDRRRWIRAAAVVLALGTVALAANERLLDILAVTRNCMTP